MGWSDRMTGSLQRPLWAVGLAASVLVLVTACQKVSEPVPILTQNQWQRVHEHILEEAPAVEHPSGAIWAGKVQLIGFDLEPDNVEAGSDVTITWYWRVLEEMEDRWEIFVHLDNRDQRQNLDHEAIGGLFTALYWEPGQIIRDIQTVQLGPRLGNGTISVYAGFWRRSDDERLPLSDPGTGTLQPDGRVLVGSFDSRRHEVSLEARARQEGEITLDGNLREADWRAAAETDAWTHPNDGSEVAIARTQAKALWDADALYLGMTATDEDIWSTFAENDQNLWEEENLEVFLDPLGDGRNYVEIQVNPRGAVFDAVFERVDGRDPQAAHERLVNLEGLEVAVALNPRNALDDREDRDRRWTLEMRIPWASLPDFGPQAASGDSLRVNFYRYERPREGDAVTVAWSPVFGGSFHQPDKFGVIRLVGTPAEAAPPGPEPEPEGTGAAVPDETGRVEGRRIPRPTERIRRIEGGTIQLLQPPTLPVQLRPSGTSE